MVGITLLLNLLLIAVIAFDIDVLSYIDPVAIIVPKFYDWDCQIAVIVSIEIDQKSTEGSRKL